MSGVESLLPATCPARRGQDADGLGVPRDEAADVVGVDAAVRVRGAAAGKEKKIGFLFGKNQLSRRILKFPIHSSIKGF